MLIGEVAERTGLAASAIRYYEQRGLIPRARRVGGRRQFEEKDLAPLLVVQLAIDAGFTLAETRRLVSEFGRDRWRRLAEKKRAEVRATAARLETMNELLGKLLRCECPSIEVCGRVISGGRGRDRALRNRSGQQLT
ncbi:MAG TPA: MerR family transcriptional regulator [Thermoanaerobaculia bacterium]|nr:MerR family transcriptional regulator [Thermoanaerobaculia bacterium]